MTLTTTTAAAEPAPGGVLRRDPDVELLGEYQGNAYAEPVYLISRGEARMQVTRVLYTVLDELDEPRTPASLAAAVSARLDRLVEPDDIEYLVHEKLRPLQLVRLPDDHHDQGAFTSTPIPDPLLALRFRFRLLPAGAVQALARPLSVLFHPLVVALAVLGYLGALAATIDHGLVEPFRQVLLEPWNLLLLYAVTVASGLWHELGHASACHRGGGRPGRIGAGVYLIWPAFFTDVTDSYRLSRRARIRTDLGGMYFNVVLGLGAYGLFLVTGFQPLLLVVVIQLAEITYQFIPLIRLDGYWLIADVTGVPDLFPLARPALRSSIPGRPTDPALAGLRPAARRIVIGWSVLAVPLLLINAVVLLLVGPTMVREGLDVAGVHLDTLRSAGEGGIGLAEVLVAAVGLVAAVLPAVGFALLALLAGIHLRRFLQRRAAGRSGDATGSRRRMAFAVVVVVAVGSAAGAAALADASRSRSTLEILPLDVEVPTDPGFTAPPDGGVEAGDRARPDAPAPAVTPATDPLPTAPGGGQGVSARAEAGGDGPSRAVDEESDGTSTARATAESTGAGAWARAEATVEILPLTGNRTGPVVPSAPRSDATGPASSTPDKPTPPAAPPAGDPAPPTGGSSRDPAQPPSGVPPAGGRTSEPAQPSSGVPPASSASAQATAGGAGPSRSQQEATTSGGDGTARASAESIASPGSTAEANALVTTGSDASAVTLPAGVPDLIAQPRQPGR
jgi:putative peptide zinc metalloprotease protein